MTEIRTVAFRRHDHAACRAAALRRAAALCESRGLNLTAARRRVLEILLESHTALGAYEVLDRLSGDGARPKPPTAYRALDFLVANGLAHRIEARNAYIACCRPEAEHDAAFLICRKCEAVAEVPAEALAPDAVRSARAAGFAIERLVYEAEGVCAGCAERAP